MPIYEYRCQKCGRHHEVSQKMSDPPLTKCPACKGKMQKLMSLAGFHLKGGGWYKDGYASASPKPAGGGDKAGTASSPPAPAGGAAEPSKKDFSSTAPSKGTPQASLKKKQQHDA